MYSLLKNYANITQFGLIKHDFYHSLNHLNECFFLNLHFYFYRVILDFIKQLIYTFFLAALTYIYYFCYKLSILKLLQTLLVILLVVVSIRMIWRYFGKMILKWLGMKMMQKVQKSFEKQAGYQDGQDPFVKTKRNTSSTFKSTSTFKSSKNKNEGEYIDFEEID